MTIQTVFVKCIQDTHDYVNAGAASRLRPWLDYSGLQLIVAIQRAIRNVHNKMNGWQTNYYGGMSLEGIVLKYEVFNNEDKKIARQTLGVK